MKKEYRLKNNSSFQYIFKKGKKYNHELLFLYKVKAANIKIGISVSKKVGNSVVRSKVKRRIKEAFRLRIDKIQGSYNFVVVARQPIAKATYKQIEDAINIVLEDTEKKNMEK